MQEEPLLHPKQEDREEQESIGTQEEERQAATRMGPAHGHEQEFRRQLVESIPVRDYA
jgi:hypothetical protein